MFDSPNINKFFEAGNQQSTLIASLVSYVVYNILLLIVTIWPAFATLSLGLYYGAIFYGIINRRRVLLVAGTIAQGIATLTLFGLFIYFMVEVCRSQTQIFNKYNVSKGYTIAMMIDTILTTAIHLLALYYCIKECRPKDESEEPPIAAMAINTELDYPQPLDIPHLQTKLCNRGVSGIREVHFPDYVGQPPVPHQNISDFITREHQLYGNDNLSTISNEDTANVNYTRGYKFYVNVDQGTLYEGLADGRMRAKLDYSGLK
ncbi:unnamed protein product [Cylicocyclus nassatus]|uniref:Uncharacterized protein n=1 Tax=Cylicocyclus nassatus TaxID=53992 RepID=A0AA36GDA2_CYLNA|nr:unnamed protein product [Cylicocyclus nassatus]